MKKSKRLIIFFIIGLISGVFISDFLRPLLDKHFNPDYILRIENHSNVDIIDLSIATSQRDELLTFDINAGQKAEYKLSKNALQENTSYNLIYENDEGSYVKQIISYKQKYQYREIDISISSNDIVVSNNNSSVSNNNDSKLFFSIFKK